MIGYLEIINRIKDVKEEAIDDFNKYVSIPLFLSNIDSTIKTIDDNILIERNNNTFILDKEARKSFSEIICILKKIELELYNKINYNYIDFFEKYKDVKYELTIDNNFETIELKYLTLEILSIFNLKFWCTEENRKSFVDSLKNVDNNDLNNEEIKFENLKENIEKENNNVEIMKNNWWITWLNKIRNIKKRILK